MTKRYDPASWYWLVGNKENEVFSSAHGAYVALDDADYLAFIADGNVATAIPLDTELAWVMWRADLVPQAIAAGISTFPEGAIAPADAVAMLCAMGVAITSTGTAALSGRYPVDVTAQAHIQAQQIYILTAQKFTNGQVTRSWPDVTGVPHTFDAAHFTEFAEAAAQYVDAVIAWGAAFAADESTPPPSNAYTIS